MSFCDRLRRAAGELGWLVADAAFVVLMVLLAPVALVLWAWWRRRWRGRW